MTPSKRSPFGQRLEEAIRFPGRPGSIRRFQEDLEERFKGRDRFGYSYPMVNSYLQGTAVPSIEWIEGAAEILDVRPAWLAFESGPPWLSAATAVEPEDRSEEEPGPEPLTPEQDFELARIQGGGEGGSRTRAALIRALEHGLGHQLPRHGALAPLEMVFWRRWDAQEEYLPEEDRLGPLELAEVIGRAAVAPLRELGMDPGERESWELEAYVPQMYGPLFALARSFGAEPEPEEEQD